MLPERNGTLSWLASSFVPGKQNHDILTPPWHLLFYPRRGRLLFLHSWPHRRHWRSWFCHLRIGSVLRVNRGHWAIVRCACRQRKGAGGIGQHEPWSLSRHCRVVRLSQSSEIALLEGLGARTRSWVLARRLSRERWPVRVAGCGCFQVSLIQPSALVSRK